MASPPPGFCLFLFKVDLVSAGNGVSPTAAGMQARLSLCPRDGGQSALGAQLGAALEMTVEIGLASSDTEGEGGSRVPGAASSVHIPGHSGCFCIRCMYPRLKREVKMHTCHRQL